MPIARSAQALAAILGLGASAAISVPSTASAALLIVGTFGDKPLRIVVDEAQSEAEVTLDGERHAVDLETGEAHRIEADGTVREAEMSAKEAGPRPDIQAWGPGPSIAGHASVYHVMRVDGEICGELLVSAWMKPFVDPAVEALAILERVRGGGGIEPAGLNGACADLPFSSYAMAGWPLMAGGIDTPIFKTETISFDYRPGAHELVAID